LIVSIPSAVSIEFQLKSGGSTLVVLGPVYDLMIGGISNANQVAVRRTDLAATATLVTGQAVNE
jgi:hypothetical protein